jgi:hypothetical protein
VRRCGKEKISYRKEVDMQKEKVEKMKADGRDEYEIRKMNEVIHIPPVGRRHLPLCCFFILTIPNQFSNITKSQPSLPPYVSLTIRGTRI